MDGPIVSPDLTSDSIAVIVIASILAIGVVSVFVCSCVTTCRERREENLMQVALLRAAPDSVHV